LVFINRNFALEEDGINDGFLHLGKINIDLIDNVVVDFNDIRVIYDLIDPEAWK
jgi:hypothetical protein